MTKSLAKQVYFGARVFDGVASRDDRALVIEGGRILALLPVIDRPRDGRQIDLGGGILSPGFVDWQVNGGGGVLFNADPSPDGIAKIAAAHRRFGTTSILPTLITDAPGVLAEGLKAAKTATTATSGSLGIHVEGPFIDPNRKGVHRPAFMRPMLDADAAGLIAAKAGVMVVTLAPNIVSLDHIRRLAEAGIIVSFGHSDATTEQALAGFDAGARAVTHLFNAMSQLQSRAPGLVGAALARKNIVCGLIADGVHVHDVAMLTAIAGKGADGVSLVSDAMPPAAGGPDSFTLQGGLITRNGNHLTDAKGTLAGAAIVMHDAVIYCTRNLGVTASDALRMATSTPARLLGLDHEIGALRAGARADLLHLGDDLALLAVLEQD